MLVKINVTQADIDKGCHGAHDCPVHEAAARVLNRECGVDGSRLVIYIFDGETLRIRLPDDVVNRIHTYDCYVGPRRMDPFSFELDIPEQYLLSQGK